jgi:hypothetical protein
LVWFEEMKKDLVEIIRQTSDFLGFDLTEDKIARLDDFLHIKNQRNHGAQSLSNGNEEVKQVGLD